MCTFVNVKNMAVALIIFVLLISGDVADRAPASNCARSCECIGFENGLNLTCNSLEFLNDPLIRDKLNFVETLNVNNASLTAIDSSLKTLWNLKTLNLASNRIQSIDAADLPRSLEYLDLSDNSFTTFPENLLDLPLLKELDLAENELECLCKVPVADYFLAKRLLITHKCKCEYPDVLYGRRLLVMDHNKKRAKNSNSQKKTRRSKREAVEITANDFWDALNSSGAELTTNSTALLINSTENWTVNPVGNSTKSRQNNGLWTLASHILLLLVCLILPCTLVVGVTIYVCRQSSTSNRTNDVFVIYNKNFDNIRYATANSNPMSARLNERSEMQAISFQKEIKAALSVPLLQKTEDEE